MVKELFEGLSVRKFCVDSRIILPGDIYCALPGARVHGEDFVQEALNKGAIKALVSSSCLLKDSRLIVVDDVLKTLQDYAREIFKEKRPRYVIGITGSLGKTTTKEFLATLLEGSFSIFKTPGNANSQVGLPLAIINEFNSEEVAIFEMGMTEPGQISKLVSIAPLDYALITKVALVHAENFSSLAEIAKTKMEIFLHPNTKVGFYPKELEVENRGNCVKKTFSVEDFSFENVPFNEAHILHNLAGALSLCAELKVNVSSQFAKLRMPAKRMEKVKKKGVLFLNDSYNAAPESVIAALKSLPSTDGKRIAILGGMHELGLFSEVSHRKVGEEALIYADHLICFGKLCTPMAEVWEAAKRPYIHLDDHDQIVDYLNKLAKPGDVVLLKGSRSNKMWTIMDKY